MPERKLTFWYLTTGSHAWESKRIRAKLFANEVWAELYYIIVSSGKARRPHLIEKGDIFTIDERNNKNNWDIIHFVSPYHVEYSNALGEVFGSHIIATQDSQELDKQIDEMYHNRKKWIKKAMARRAWKKQNNN